MNASTVGLKSRRRGEEERGVRYFVGEDPGRDAERSPRLEVAASEV